jgi:hypothetical protein
MLGILQREGRLIDFLEEDVASFTDAQIGAAVRDIHKGCKKALAPGIREIAAGIVPFLGDAHPRVRQAAGNTLGELIGDFQQGGGERHHRCRQAPPRFLPPLLQRHRILPVAKQSYNR